MPHCIFEYTDNVVDSPNWGRIIGKIHENFVAAGFFKLNDIKSRVIKHENYFMGNGERDNAFVTLNIQLLDGRSDEIKSQISKIALDELVGEFPETFKKNKFSLTVQVTDIHRASYQKYVSY